MAGAGGPATSGAVSPLLVSLFLGLLVALAVVAVRARDLLAAVLSLGAYSFVMSLVWAGMGAVDVAFTEAVVGAGASTVFFLAALLGTVREERAAGPGRWPLALGTMVALGALLAVAAHDFPAWGDPDSPPSRHVSPRYLLEGARETGAPNIVTAVLADYRGYDTLVETVVIFTAAVACALLLARGRS